MDHLGMDHGGMDHGDMDHGHGGHGGMDEDMCNMNMLFNWDTTNFCIVFRQWHVRSSFSLFASFVAVVLLAMGYEALRNLSRRYEQTVSNRVGSLPIHDTGDDAVTETTPFVRPGQNQEDAYNRAHITKGVLYALQNFYGLMLMLVFMTYNAWIMIAVAIGAFAGYVVFGKGSSATKDEVCH